MIQNDLHRLFGGITKALQHVVLPDLRDPYARVQVTAAIDLLVNLAERVEWRCDDLEAFVAHVRDVLGTALALAPDAPEFEQGRTLLAERGPAGTSNAALVEARRRHLSALADVQVWAAEHLAGGTPEADRLRAMLDETVRWSHEIEYRRLKDARAHLRSLLAAE